MNDAPTTGAAVARLIIISPARRAPIQGGLPPL
jgi:hypothetical protein